MKCYARRYPSRTAAKRAYDNAVKAIEDVDVDVALTLNFYRPVGGWICAAVGDDAHPELFMGGVGIEVPSGVVAVLYDRKQAANVPPGQLHRIKNDPPVSYKIPYGGDA